MFTLNATATASLTAGAIKRIQELCPQAKDFSVGHNDYCLGVFWNGEGYGRGNHEFMPFKNGNGDLYPASEYEIELPKEKTFFQQCVDRIKAGETVEVNEEIYYHFLECVPPLTQGSDNFICGEPYSMNRYFRFYEENGKYYGELTEV